MTLPGRLAGASPGARASSMPTLMRGLEKDLQTLINRVAPGNVRLNITRAAWLREYGKYEVSVQTRSFDELSTGKTIGDATRSALDASEQPAVGAACTRRQRCERDHSCLVRPVAA